nr:hypothetical protein [Tanacetum cinerariifolium]
TKSLHKPECEQLFREVKSKDPLEIPIELKAPEGTKHIFQLHFSPGYKKGRVEFILHDVFDQKRLLVKL